MKKADTDGRRGNENYRNDGLLLLVKQALREANLLQLTVIEEREDGWAIKPRPLNTEEKIRLFESLAGSALPVGEDVKELLKIANREEEEWRDQGLE
ncbi:hypothetical protein [Geobacillus sp. BK01]|uniref:hypothetical protein n=1 Tax=Geobacillus sp. BK01 TaxID=3457328 RepID=UPI003FA53635